MTVHTLKARKVQFDLSTTPLHWIPNDPFATHLINSINLILPAGELWFCRVFNQALPLIKDEKLRLEVKGFIAQEGMHARAHKGAWPYLERHNIDITALLARSDRIFGTLLSDAPLGINMLNRKRLQKPWLIARVGLVAAIEHFTGFLGQWCMDNTSWDKAEPTMADLFRWHLAEEVEHRSVAYDLYEHLCKTELGFYVSRQAMMAAVFPLFIYLFMDGYRQLAAQDQDDEHSLRLARSSMLRLLLELESNGISRENVPRFSAFCMATLHWISPRFHPESEGNTEQALSYLARSPAARAALAREQPVAQAG
ncbi:MAG: metal-dependent hydrolase [Paraperlucidibaca sp.]|nr:metal-dependent hydrolase [Paraperlucidibaca sp.]